MISNLYKHARKACPFVLSTIARGIPIGLTAYFGHMLFTAVPTNPDVTELGLMLVRGYGVGLMFVAVAGVCITLRDALNGDYTDDLVCA